MLDARARRTVGDDRRTAALVALGAAPTGAALVRLTQVATGSTAADVVRFVADPVATVVHLVGVPVFVVGGALQLRRGVLRRAPRLHRLTGRAVAAAGIGIALSGAWMTLTWELPPPDRTLGLTVSRLVASSAMAGALVQATRSARARRWDSHRAWALRGWAIGMGAGTQALTHTPLLLAGQSIREFDPDDRFVAMLAGWLINVAAAEYVIRRGRAAPDGSQRPPAHARRPDPSTRTTVRSIP